MGEGDERERLQTETGGGRARRGLEFLKEDLLDQDEGKDARKISICKGTEVAQRDPEAAGRVPGGKENVVRSADRGSRAV